MHSSKRKLGKERSVEHESSVEKSEAYSTIFGGKARDDDEGDRGDRFRSSRRIQVEGVRVYLPELSVSRAQGVPTTSPSTASVAPRTKRGIVAANPFRIGFEWRRRLGGYLSFCVTVIIVKCEAFRQPFCDVKPLVCVSGLEPQGWFRCLGEVGVARSKPA